MEKAKTKGYDTETYIMKFFKQLLHEWEVELAARPDDVKRTAKGREETRTQKQCKDYLAPFFRMCKKKVSCWCLLCLLCRRHWPQFFTPTPPPSPLPDFAGCFSRHLGARSPDCELYGGTGVFEGV